MQPSNTLAAASTSKEGWNQEIRARVQGIGAAWNNVSGVMYDRRMPVRLKKQIYKIMVRPAGIYGSETWAVKKQHLCKLEVAEMKCLKVTRGVTRKEKYCEEDRDRDGRTASRKMEDRSIWSCAKAEQDGKQ